MKVSVITPSYNQGQFIERTILSVLQQKIPTLQYLVMDGNSDDETQAILARYQGQLTYISEPDNGQTHAINKGLKLASGDIIGWLNSDDVYYPGAIQHACDFFQNNPDIDVLYGQAHHIDQNDAVIEAYPTMPWHFSKLKQCCFIAQPAVFFRRRIFEREGYLDESLNYCMDYEYWIRLGKTNTALHYLPLVLAGTRLHPQTKTSSQSRAMQAEVMTMLKRHLGYVPSRWFLTYAYAVLRTQGQFRKNPYALLKLYLIASSAALQHNTWQRAIIDMLKFPGLLLKLAYQKSHRSAKVAKNLFKVFE